MPAVVHLLLPNHRHRLLRPHSILHHRLLQLIRHLLKAVYLILPNLSSQSRKYIRPLILLPLAATLHTPCSKRRI
ncbi:MAG: hypothetical protein M5U34_47375 [Chloroflexi bacterium]|nr:hypothetical protein [Chloroflexota bacterium]